MNDETTKPEVASDFIDNSINNKLKQEELLSSMEDIGIVDKDVAKIIADKIEPETIKKRRTLITRLSQTLEEERKKEMFIFKRYDKKYENVYSDQVEIKKDCDKNKISNSLGFSFNDYISLLEETHHSLQEKQWDTFLKLYWLWNAFFYNKKDLFGEIPRGQKKTEVMRAFKIFYNHNLGRDYIFTARNIEYRIFLNYLVDIYPDFLEHNPFKKEIKFPYQYMNMECMYFVMLHPHRIELLKYGEDNRMRFDEFADYVINHISCFNEEVGRNVFWVDAKYNFSPRITWCPRKKPETEEEIKIVKDEKEKEFVRKQRLLSYKLNSVEIYLEKIKIKDKQLYELCKTNKIKTKLL